MNPRSDATTISDTPGTVVIRPDIDLTTAQSLDHFVGISTQPNGACEVHSDHRRSNRPGQPERRRL